MAHALDQERLDAGATGLSVHGAILLALFCLSGVAALAYQTIWQRMLGLVAGSDAVAATLIVGAFLFGLGVGSMIGAQCADRLSARAAIKGFAWCEIGIGVIGASSRLLFHDVLFHGLGPFITSPAMAFIVITLALLPPTILMGMSLPLLARAIVRTVASAPRHIGWLYGLNTLGAAAGSLVAGCLVIPALGYDATSQIAGGCNVGIGLIALILARHADTAIDRGSAVVSTGANRTMVEWSIVVFVAGFLIISLEIVWFRVLGVMMQGNAYYFALVLGVFLLGDALGIILGAELVRRIREPRHLFPGLQGAVALYAVASLTVLSDAHGWFGIWPDLAVPTHQSEASATAIAAGFTALALFAVFPPAVLLGMSFPLVHKAVQDDPNLIGTRVGLVQLANIFGNTAGAVVTGLLLLHVIGTTGTLRLLAVTAAVMTLWPLLARGTGPVPSRAPNLALAAVLLIAVPVIPNQLGFWAGIHGATASPRVLAGEDRTGVALVRPASDKERGIYGLPKDGPQPRLLYVLGHTQSSLPFLTHHGVLGMVGPLVHPSPDDVLVIGHGIGGTPFGVAINPRPKHIRVVEIIGPIFPLLHEIVRDPTIDHLAEPVNRMLGDPRIVHTVADARHVLLMEDRRYDVIEADAVYPWSSGAGLLYSQEFFRQVLTRLKPGGIFVQWAATERTRATFLSVFPHVVHAGFVLLGSNQPIPFSRSAIEHALEPDLRARMRQVGWIDSRFLGVLTSDEPRVWGPGSPRVTRDLNTDLFPRDEYRR